MSVKLIYPSFTPQASSTFSYTPILKNILMEDDKSILCPTKGWNLYTFLTTPNVT